MTRITAALRKGMELKEGDRADLRVVMENGELVVTHLINHVKSGAHSPDYQVKLGHWNRK
jgi:hypothetical protein